MEMIPITLKEMQSIEFAMMLELQKVCIRNKLRYYIDGGTLLGSYCYGGFIPWDDDIDIKMPRSDYERLGDFRNELPEYVKLKMPEEDNFAYTFAKLYDTRTVLIENPETDEEHVGGVYIDILPMDGYPKDTKLLRRIERYKTLFHLSKNGFFELRTSDSLKVRIKGNIYKRLYSPAKVLQSMTELAKQTAYEEADIVGLVIDGNLEKEKYRRLSFEPPTLLPFESGLFPASADYEEHLKRFYGSHVLQSKSKRNLPQYPANHRYRVYWKDNNHEF